MNKAEKAELAAGLTSIAESNRVLNFEMYQYEDRNELISSLDQLSADLRALNARVAARLRAECDADK